jgi:hypothetical protein
MIREVQRIAEHSGLDLALQWDVCLEMIQWDGRVPSMPPLPGWNRSSPAPSRASPDPAGRG